MNKINVLDVTLRDGGCINNFNFGSSYMRKILKAQEKSGIDIIELGYIDDKNGSVSERTQFINEKVIYQNFLKDKKSDIYYVAMVDYGKYNFSNLEPKKCAGIDGIRLAFHKKNAKDVISIGRTIIDKGYMLFLQPMVTLRYSDFELLDLIADINQNLPELTAFYVVDSFGEMRSNDVNHLFNIVDKNLFDYIAMGFHSHNNIQMSYSNACSLLSFPTKRSIIIDSSIMGMGKGAGNLNTELLLEHLNLFYKKNYSISPLLDVIDKVINPLHSEYYWGYSPEYYLSSINHCTPSYASHFYNKHMLPIDQVGELLDLIQEDKKLSFDINYAESLYKKYNESKTVDDSETILEFKSEFKGKRILLVAPGKSVLKQKNKILSLASSSDIVSIGLNHDLGFDYIITTRLDIYNELLKKGTNIVAPSNISKGGRGNIRVLDYKKWVEFDGSTHDSSGVIALKLLKACEVSEILLAGFDGFSTDINENYYNSELRYPVTADQVSTRNQYFKGFVKRIASSGISIKFITESKYEEK